jgi:hypothetical protein
LDFERPDNHIEPFKLNTIKELRIKRVIYQHGYGAVSTPAKNWLSGGLL